VEDIAAAAIHLQYYIIYIMRTKEEPVALRT